MSNQVAEPLGDTNSTVQKARQYKKKSQMKSIWLRFRKNRMGMLGLVMFLVMVIVVFGADVYLNYEDDAIAHNPQERLQGPSRDHSAGTDEFGRDILARVIYGGRISMFVGMATVCVSLTLGICIGAPAAFYGGRVDNVLMRFMDVLMAIPGELLAIALIAALGSSMANLILAMGVSQTPRMSRIVRSSVLSVKEQEYVEAARACGAGDVRIILRHILPNSMGPILVQATQTVARSILTISSLSFIGLGISEPTPEWGSMLSAARSQFRHYPHLAIPPGIAIVMSVMSLTLVGDGLRDALDPRLKN